jgi:hypothetical protein
MKKLVLVLFLAALAAPAVAHAKGALGVEVCGADGCRQQRFAAAYAADGGPFTGMGGIVTPAKPGPWLRGSILIGDPTDSRVFGRVAFFYVPGADLMIDPGDSSGRAAWFRPTGELGRLVRALAPQITPFKAPKVVVAVNGDAVNDPSSYLRLFTVGKRTDAYPKSDHFVQITFSSKTKSPWTTGNDVALYTADRLLVRDGEIVAVSRALADRIEAGSSLAPGSRIPWRLLALTLATLAVLVLLAAVRLRTRPAPRPVPQA